jgi:hypothetical protein
VDDAGVRLSEDIWEEEEKLDDNDRRELDMLFGEEEIHEIVDQMEKNKAEGPDGIPVEFVQS